MSHSNRAILSYSLPGSFASAVVPQTIPPGQSEQTLTQSHDEGQDGSRLVTTVVETAPQPANIQRNLRINAYFFPFIFPGQAKGPPIFFDSHGGIADMEINAYALIKVRSGTLSLDKEQRDKAALFISRQTRAAYTSGSYPVFVPSYWDRNISTGALTRVEAVTSLGPPPATPTSLLFPSMAPVTTSAVPIISSSSGSGRRRSGTVSGGCMMPTLLESGEDTNAGGIGVGENTVTRQPSRRERRLALGLTEKWKAAQAGEKKDGDDGGSAAGGAGGTVVA